MVRYRRTVELGDLMIMKSRQVQKFVSNATINNLMDQLGHFFEKGFRVYSVVRVSPFSEDGKRADYIIVRDDISMFASAGNRLGSMVWLDG